MRKDIGCMPRCIPVTSPAESRLNTTSDVPDPKPGRMSAEHVGITGVGVPAQASADGRQGELPAHHEVGTADDHHDRGDRAFWAGDR